MFRSHSPRGNEDRSYAGSIQSNGYSTTTDEVSSQVSALSRPSASSIYLQRRAYAASVNQDMDKFQYRVEHLFTCELDGRELRSVADCVERLKLLDGMGRVWGQAMQLEVCGVDLLLTDSGTEEELESIALSDILELKAVLKSGTFNSLLTMTVRPGGKRSATVFLFQCEDVRADYVQRDLSLALARRRENPSHYSNAGFTGARNAHRAAMSSEPQEHRAGVPPVPPAYGLEDDDVLKPEPQEEEGEEEEKASTSRVKEPLPKLPRSDELCPHPRDDTELDKSVDIFNHILGDIEIFMGHIVAVAAKNAKKKKKKKNVMAGMPSREEFADCLQKLKYSFNLLGELNGKIGNPSAPEFVHALFSTLSFLISHGPEDLPATIVVPLLTPQCIRLLSEEVSTEEDQLWQSLGDAWNIPSTKWPEDHEAIPTYGDVAAAAALGGPVSAQTSANWTPQRPRQTRSGESKPSHMRVMYDFVSRNQRELTIRKGETVQLLDKSKQWWKVGNGKGEEGYVPSNVLEDPEDQFDKVNEGSPVLTVKSRPAEVKAWLEDMGFHQITVRCLGVLGGSALLEMTREELKTVCPEDGGRVFLQLQAVKSHLAAPY